MPSSSSASVAGEAGQSLDTLRQEFKAVAAESWCHNFDLAADGQFVPAESLRYRSTVLVGVFQSLFAGREVLVLDETTGLFPLLAARAGALRVTANNPNPRNCALMEMMARSFQVPLAIRNDALIKFEGSDILVDVQAGEKHAYMFVQNRIWPLYCAARRSFNDVVDACAHYVTDGVVIDWTDARWAKPPVEYNRAAFHDALRRRFEFVLACNDWLTVALGKLVPPC